MRLSFRVLHSFPSQDTYLRVMGVGLMLDANNVLTNIEVICQSKTYCYDATSSNGKVEISMQYNDRAFTLKDFFQGGIIARNTLIEFDVRGFK